MDFFVSWYHPWLDYLAAFLAAMRRRTSSSDETCKTMACCNIARRMKQQMTNTTGDKGHDIAIEGRSIHASLGSTLQKIGSDGLGGGRQWNPKAKVSADCSSMPKSPTQAVHLYLPWYWSFVGLTGPQ